MNGYPSFYPKIALVAPSSSRYGLDSLAETVVSWDPFYQHGLILIPAWICNLVFSKVWGEITFAFPNFNGCTVEVWEWISPYFTVHEITYACLKLIRVSKMALVYDCLSSTCISASWYFYFVRWSLTREAGCVEAWPGSGLHQCQLHPGKLTDESFYIIFLKRNVRKLTSSPNW